jgi:hypothetical protein
MPEVGNVAPTGQGEAVLIVEFALFPTPAIAVIVAPCNVFACPTKHKAT